MDVIIIRFYITIIFLGAILSIVHILGEYPAPLPKSENPKKNLIEVGIYSLILILYLTLLIFIIDPFGNLFYITIIPTSIIYLLIPLIYTCYKDNWKSKDLGINSKIQSRWVVIVGIPFFAYLGYYNYLLTKISWDVLLILIYSNAFLEEFLFRGVIQSKFERALGQRKAIICQGFLFMLMHFPVNTFEYSLHGDIIRFIWKFEFQFITGIIYGLIYLKTRNIWPSVICHYLGNYFGTIIRLFL